MAVHKANPYYGVARFAIELNWTEKKARRIRNLAGITAAKRTKKNRHKPGVAEVTAPMNALKAYADFKNVMSSSLFNEHLIHSKFRFI